MEVEQALNILFQAIDVAVAQGAFKSSRDVAVVEQAKGVVAQALQPDTKTIKQPEAKLEKK